MAARRQSLSLSLSLSVSLLSFHFPSTPLSQLSLSHTLYGFAYPYAFSSTLSLSLGSSTWLPLVLFILLTYLASSQIIKLATAEGGGCRKEEAKSALSQVVKAAPHCSCYLSSLWIRLAPAQQLQWQWVIICSKNSNQKFRKTSPRPRKTPSAAAAAAATSANCWQINFCSKF